jgi:1,4-dihydroxy-2-naphthoate polyprenyltransferase
LGRADLIKVVRVPILIGGALGYGVGVLLGLASAGKINPLQVVLCYLVVALGDLSTHYSNDYFDVELDRISPRKTFGGSNLLVARGDLMTAALLSAEILSFASVGLSFIAVLLGAPLILMPLAVGANLLGWSYSILVKFAHRGLGEVAIAIGTGFCVPAAGYLAVKGTLDIQFLTTSMALMLLGFVLSLSLELPDAEADRAGGKMNLVARFGVRICLRLALLLCFCSTAMLFLFSEASLASASLVPLATVAWCNFSKESKMDVISTACILSLFAFLVVSFTLLLVPLISF